MAKPKFILLVLFLVLIAASPSFAQSKAFLDSLARARAGDVDAQNKVGIAYSEGKGVKPNQKRAVYWFRMGAEQGDAITTCNVALHYLHGWGVKRNYTLMWKYVFAAHALDGLKCNPGSVSPKLRKHCSMERGWELAVAWLQAHPRFKNNFAEKPWMSETDEYPTTVRTSGDSMQLPVKRTGKCRGTRKSKRPRQANN